MDQIETGKAIDFFITTISIITSNVSVLSIPIKRLNEKANMVYKKLI